MTTPDPALIRAARALLDWDQARLAEASGVSVSAIRNYERGATRMTAAGRAALVRAIEEAGVEIQAGDETAGAGVRWAAPAVRAGERDSRD